MTNPTNQASPARARAERYPSTQVAGSLGSPSAARRLGRPPLSPSGPQTPGRRSRAASSLSNERRNKVRRSLLAQDKANKMWQNRRGGAEPELSDEEMMQLEDRLNDGGANEGGGGDEEGGGDDEGGGVDGGGGEGEFGGYSKGPFFEYKKKLITLMESESNSRQSVRLDMLARLLRNYNYEWNDDLFQASSRLSSLSVRTIQRKVAEVRTLLESLRNPLFMLEHYLKTEVLPNNSDNILLQRIGFIVPASLTSKFERVLQIYASVKTEILSNRRGPSRNLCIEAAVKTAQNAQLSLTNRGDAQTLRNVLGSKHGFATKILAAIDQNKVDSLYTYSMKRDSLKLSPWPGLLKTFARKEVNARPCPGLDTISVAYGKREVKYLLRKPMKVVIEDFKKDYPECPFAPSTLVREWPLNVVTGTERDVNRWTIEICAKNNFLCPQKRLPCSQQHQENGCVSQ